MQRTTPEIKNSCSAAGLAAGAERGNPDVKNIIDLQLRYGSSLRTTHFSKAFPPIHWWMPVCVCVCVWRRVRDDSLIQCLRLHLSSLRNMFSSFNLPVFTPKIVQASSQENTAM